MTDSSQPPNPSDGSGDRPAAAPDEAGAVPASAWPAAPAGAGPAAAGGPPIPLPEVGAAPVWPHTEGLYPTGQHPTGEYPTAGYPTGEYPTAGYPTGEYPTAGYPTGEYPTNPGPGSAPGVPTPPGGTWPPPGGWGPAPGFGPAPGGWGGTPPYGGWPYPGYSGPAPQHQPAKKRTFRALSLAGVAVIVAAFVGVGLGHAVWPSQSANSATQGSGSTGSAGSSGSNGSSGFGYSPYGSGSSGSSGNSGSGNSSTGAGAPSNISAIAAKVQGALVDVNTNMSYEDEQAAGTGMVLSSNGTVLTNNHVIDGATSISVTDIGNGKTYKATVVGYDRTGDIAVLKLTGASGLDTITASKKSVAVGQAVVGVGNAGGTGGTPSSVGGSVTALDQSITASDEGGGNSENLSGLIQTNAGIQAGDSGGSLVNTAGDVIGMDTAASESTGFQESASQAYAIPIATALSTARQILDGKSSSTVHIGPTAFIGVSVSESSSSSGSGSSGGSYGIGGGSYGFGTGNSGNTGNTGNTGGGSSAATGASVEQVLSGSPAAGAGLAEGDVITAVDGHAVTSATSLSNLLQGDRPGQKVTLTWTDTSGSSHSARITLATGPPA